MDAARVRFSIIIPTHNAETFLGRAIESVLSQSFRNFEIIIVDDKSDDDTWSIARKYQQRHHPENEISIFNGDCGVSDSRNVGYATAGGEYILFLDADDTYEPTALETLDKCIRENNNPDILFSGYNRVAEDQTLIKPFSYLFPNCTGVQLAVDYLNKKSYTHLGALCFSHLFLAENNLWFDRRLSFAEDIVFATQAFLLAKTVCSTNTTIHNWTLRKGSTIYTNTTDRFQSLSAIASLKDFQLKNKFKSKQLSKAIANHYAMLLLDTVNTLSWLGSDTATLNSEIDKQVDFSFLFPYIHLQPRLRTGVLGLRYRRKAYLQRIQSKAIPINFVKTSKDSFDAK
jgi:hypothetical protein